jgi:hypothetical protein
VGTVREELDAAEEQAAELARQVDVLSRWDALADADPLGGEEAGDLLERVAFQGPMRDDEHFEFDDWELMDAAGVPEEEREEPGGWGGGTVGHVRAGMAHLVARQADDVGDPLPLRLARAVREAERSRAKWAEQVERLRAELERMEATLAERESEARRRVLLPAADPSERVMRYESHLQKQLVQTLHELERLRAYRSEYPPQPPVAVDVTVHGVDGLPALTGG